MKNSLEIRVIQSEEDYNEILNVRNVVFVQEQKVPPKIEFDGLDKKSTHVIVKLNNTTVGCARIRSIDGKMKLERIAILKQYRGKGLGKKLIDFLLFYHKQVGAKEIVIHAQYRLKGFYERIGFKTRGKEFDEANIKHIAMYYAGL